MGSSSDRVAGALRNGAASAKVNSTIRYNRAASGLPAQALINLQERGRNFQLFLHSPLVTKVLDPDNGQQQCQEFLSYNCTIKHQILWESRKKTLAVAVLR